MTRLTEMTLQSGLFILLLLVLRPLLKKPLSATVRYALWSIPALRLLIPLSFKSVLGLWQHMPIPTIPLDRGQTDLLLPAAVTPFIADPILSPSDPATGMASIPPAQQVWIPPVHTILSLIWLFGSLVMFVLFIRVNLRFYRSVRNAVRVGGIDSPIPVMLVNKDIPPCLAGFLRPRILLPGHVLASPELSHMVILHEVTHFRHKDHLFTALRNLLLILWWWNPLVWVMVRLSKEDCEAACDEGVIRCMTLDERKNYGKSLVALLSSHNAHSALLAAGTAMDGNKKIIKERITMIANLKQKGRLFTLAAVLSIVLLVPILFSSAQNTNLAQPYAVSLSQPPMSAEAILQRRYAAFSYDEQLRLLRAIEPLLGRADNPLKQHWEEAAGKARQSIQGQVEEPLKAQDAPLEWAEADKAKLLDALAAAFKETGYPLSTEGLSIQDKAQRFTDLVADTGDLPDNDDEEETWQDEWHRTLTSPAFLTIQGKVDFKAQWAPKVETLLKSGLPLPENGDLRHLLSIDFRLPEAGSISEAQALEKARASILDKKGWKAGELDNTFRLWSSACLTEKDGTPVYWFAFSWDEEKLITDSKIDALEGKRIAQQFPLNLAVKINAKTSELHTFIESFDLQTPYNRII